MLEQALKQVTETQNTDAGVPSAPQEESPLSEVEKLKAELRKKEEQLTSKFHGLTARERMLMQKEMELKEKLGQVGSVDELRGLAEKDPLKLLEKFGLNYDKLTDIYAGMTPEDETKKTVGTLKSEIEELKNKLTEQESQGQMKEIMRVKAAKLDALKGLASREGSDYNLISHFGNYDDVLAYMSEHYNATGEILSDEEALEHVESRLAESLKSLGSNSKVKALLGFKEQADESGQEQAKPFGLGSVRNEPTKPESTKGLSEQQLWELALAKMPDLK
jgi:hypothetical protein